METTIAAISTAMSASGIGIVPEWEPFEREEPLQGEQDSTEQDEQEQEGQSSQTAAEETAGGEQ